MSSEPWRPGAPAVIPAQEVDVVVAPPFRVPDVPSMTPEDATRRGYWVGSEAPLQFAAGVAPVIAVATWGSPIFDLRPELRSSYEPRLGNTQAIWRAPAFGGGGRLLVQISTLDGVNIEDYALSVRVDATELLHISRSDSVRVSNVTNATSELLDGRATAVLEFLPPGNPIRFWQLQLTVNILDVGVTPAWSAIGSYY